MRSGRPASLAQVVVAVVLVQAVGGVLTASIDDPAPVAAPTPIAETITPRQLTRIIARAIESSPDTPAGRRLNDTLSEIIEGDVIVTPPPAAPSTTTTTTTTSAPPVTADRVTTGADITLPTTEP